MSKVLLRRGMCATNISRRRRPSLGRRQKKKVKAMVRDPNTKEANTGSCSQAVAAVAVGVVEMEVAKGRRVGLV